jgi:hypothetical protein
MACVQNAMSVWFRVDAWNPVSKLMMIDFKDVLLLFEGLFVGFGVVTNGVVFFKC